MWAEIVKIIPKIDAAALSAMEKALTGRFARVAKKFGAGLKSAIVGGGILTLGLSVISKLLNPLKETQEVIDRILGKSDDIADNAAQFNTTTGKMAKLQALGEAKGLAPEQVDMLVQKFQNAVSEAARDPKKQTSVRNYVDEKDAVDGFYKFMAALRLMKTNDQIAVQQEVFGEKQIGKMSAFLKEDLDALAARMGLANSETYTAPIDKVAALNDFKEELAARRNLNDQVNKSAHLNRGQIISQDKSAREEMARENERLDSYQNTKKISESMDKIMFQMERGMNWLAAQSPVMLDWLQTAGNAMAKVVNSLDAMLAEIKGLKNSRLFKGIFGGGDK